MNGGGSVQSSTMGSCTLFALKETNIRDKDYTTSVPHTMPKIAINKVMNILPKF